MADPCSVGIDVSKATLDVAWSTNPTTRWQTTNDDAGWTALVAHVRALQPTVIVLEATGGYEIGAASALSTAALPVAIVNPRQVRDFAKALGLLEKTDGIDAAVLATFGARIQPTPRPLPDDLQADLQALVTRRRQLVDMLTAERNRVLLARGAVRRTLWRTLPGSRSSWGKQIAICAPRSRQARYGAPAISSCNRCPALARPPPPACWRRCPSSERSVIGKSVNSSALRLCLTTVAVTMAIGESKGDAATSDPPCIWRP